MGRLSLWNPKKGNDYKFIDKTVKAHFDHGGTSLLIHKYIGSQDKDAAEYDPASPAIQDLLFLENRDRKYEKDLYDLKNNFSGTRCLLSKIDHAMLSNYLYSSTEQYEEPICLIQR